MLDQLTELQSSTLLIQVTTGLIVGLVGSLHCTSMCGPLSTACSKNTQDIFLYQIGRIFSYLVLALICSLIGKQFIQMISHSFWSVIPSLLLGIFFIFIGLKNIQIFKDKFQNSKLLEKFNKKTFSFFLNSKSSFFRSFGVGFSSIFLPCGFLYGVIFALTTFHEPLNAFLTLFAFWLGTLPAMIMAPSLLFSIIKPIQNRFPLIINSSFVILGFSTIIFRLLTWYEIYEKSCN